MHAKSCNFFRFFYALVSTGKRELFCFLHLIIIHSFKKKFMPSISNLQLNIQPVNANDPQSPRTVSVTFTTNFNATEMFAHVVYRAEVNLKSQRGATEAFDLPANRFVGRRNIRSVASQVQTTISNSFNRSSLDEDADFRIVNGNLQEVSPVVRDDEWAAEVTLTPLVFDTVTAQSPVVVGTWGPLALG